MSMNIYVEAGNVLLAYCPEQIGPDNYLDLLEEKEYLLIYNTFAVSQKIYYTIDIDDIIFVIGREEEGYNRIFSEVLGTKRDYCFDNRIKLGKKDFIAARKTPILKMLDKLINITENEVYIDLKCEQESCNHIFYDDFRKFQKSIPHNAELNKYIWMRSAIIFREIFPHAEEKIEIYEKWIARVERSLAKSTINESGVNNLDYCHAVDYKKLIKVREQLRFFVDNCDLYQEKTFQQAISEVVRFVFPKYLYAVREVRFKGIDLHDKQPDFVLIDYNGMIDFMEIKKPTVKIINNTTYRNNYSPSRELSGAVQQVEKYIACIQRCAGEWEKKPPKIINDSIPTEFDIRVINPQGLILMGNAKEFTLNQKRDFELIKRQYKNVAEIITYDDLINRVDNMIKALKPYGEEFQE